MFFNHLARSLEQIIQQPEWQQYRQHCQIKECWHRVVSPKALTNTKPLYLDRQTLYVATSSSVWAQELALQRYSLIKKLNSHLDFAIADIRFSPANWHYKQQTVQQEIIFRAVDSSKSKTSNNREHPTAKQDIDARSLVKNWLENRQKQSQNSANCPQCNSLTPQAELTRWQMCRHCVARQWHDRYKPPSRN